MSAFNYTVTIGSRMTLFHTGIFVSSRLSACTAYLKYFLEIRLTAHKELHHLSCAISLN